MRLAGAVRTAVLALSVLALVASLAGRTFAYQGDQHKAVSSGHVTPKRQKLERQAPAWSIPVAVFLPLLWTEFSESVTAPSDPLVSARPDSCLYKRPPPCLSL